MHQPAFRAKAVVTVYPPGAGCAPVSDAQVAGIQHIGTVDVCAGKGKEGHSTAAARLVRPDIDRAIGLVLGIDDGMPA